MSKPPPPHIVVFREVGPNTGQSQFISEAASTVPPGSASVFSRRDAADASPVMHMIVGASSGAQLLSVLTAAVRELQELQGQPGFETDPVCFHLSSQVLTRGR
jgi:hypothetical protein